MKQLIDFLSIPHNKFWGRVDKNGDAAEDTFKQYWEEADMRLLTQEEAVECLNALFLYSHKRIREYSKVLAKYYPTKQYTKNRLKKEDYLWWIDHFTAGISKWSTLSWFSAKKDYYRGITTLDPQSANLAYSSFQLEQLRQLIDELKTDDLEPLRQKEILEQMQGLLDHTE